MQGDLDQEAPVQATAPIDRAQAFAGRAPAMSRRVLYLGIAAIVVAGVGGSLVDRMVDSPGPSPPRRAAATPPAAARPAPPPGTQLHAPLRQFLGLTPLKGRKAPPLSLTDAATGAPVSLASLRGHVVVLTFASAACNDICPVLASEIAQAAALVGTSPLPVTFLTVNSDPLETKATSGAGIMAATTLPALDNWRFLTGPVHRLDKIWTSYGIGITVNTTTRAVSHNNLLYFIGPNGTMAWSATPVADESPTGAFTLPAPESARFAHGVAHYALTLARAS
ncbi:MAG: SCO family protein [Acidimicrobiales bacterium]